MSPSAASAIAVMNGRPNLPVAVAAVGDDLRDGPRSRAAHGQDAAQVHRAARVEGKTIDEMGKILVDEYMDAGLAVVGRASPSTWTGDPSRRTDAHQARTALQRGLSEAAAGDREAFCRAPEERGEGARRG